MTQQIGETREFLGENFLSKTLVKIIDKQGKTNPSLKQYYIFISAKPDKLLHGVIRQAVKITAKKPPKLFNSMCFRVDTERGILENEWILPLDTGNAYGNIIGDEESQIIAQNVKGMENILA